MNTITHRVLVVTSNINGKTRYFHGTSVRNRIECLGNSIKENHNLRRLNPQAAKEYEQNIRPLKNATLQEFVVHIGTYSDPPDLESELIPEVAKRCGISPAQFVVSPHDDLLLWNLFWEEKEHGPYPAGCHNVISSGNNCARIILIDKDTKGNELKRAHTVVHEGEHAKQTTKALEVLYSEPFYKIVSEGGTDYKAMHTLVSIAEEETPLGKKLQRLISNNYKRFFPIENSLREMLNESRLNRATNTLEKLEQMFTSRHFRFCTYDEHLNLIKKLVNHAGEEGVLGLHTEGKVGAFQKAIGNAKFKAMLSFWRAWTDVHKGKLPEHIRQLGCSITDRVILSANDFKKAWAKKLSDFVHQTNKTITKVRRYMSLEEFYDFFDRPLCKPSPAESLSNLALLYLQNGFSNRGFQQRVKNEIGRLESIRTPFETIVQFITLHPPEERERISSKFFNG